MRWRVITAAGLLIFLLAGGFWAQGRTARICDETDALLISPALREQNARQAAKIWEQSQPLLSSLIPHDRLEEVSCSLQRLIGLLQAGEEGEARAECLAVRAQLQKIRDFDQWTIQSLL